MKILKKKLWVALAVVAGLCMALRFTGPVDDRIMRAASLAAWSGDMLKLRMIRLLGVNINKPVPGQAPLLVMAAETGQHEIIAYLLATGADIEIKDKFGGTALFRAAEYGHTETVRMLINAGANVNVRDLEGGNTPLDACRMNFRRNGFDLASIADLLVKAGAKAETTKEPTGEQGNAPAVNTRR